MDTEHDCNRKFLSGFQDKKEQGLVRSSRNIFLYGRGGTTSFKYTFLQNVLLRIVKSIFFI